jgi:UDP-4-amino-4,6-dideoxy-N-acetyl-beta-L-altrosamine transaminase
MIPYGRQDIHQKDVEAVIDVLRSDFLTQGPLGPKFEAALALKVGAKHAVVSNSATSSLHLACLALGLGPGDLFWTSPITFVATSNAALYCGADVDFVDVDPATYNLCPIALEAKLADARKKGRLPKIVAPVNMCGQSCDLATIRRLADEYGFAILEDASHAVGGHYRGRPVGCCEFSDIAIFSFHPVKIITTAEGGMALTNDDGLASRMRLLCSHGITRDETLMTGASEGPWYYEQLGLGFNYRMTEVQSALGLSQLERLDEYVRCRGALADRYDRLLSDLPVRLPGRSNEAASAWHLYAIRVPDSSKRRAIFESMRADGIGVNVHYIPVHTQPYYRALGFAEGDFPVAEAYYGEAISLPLFPTLTHEQQDEVVAALKKALKQ